MVHQKIRKLTILSLITALSLILSYIESQIPPLVPVPGIKMGLGHIAVIFTLYKFGTKEALSVSIVRTLLMGLLFGNAMGFLFSISGALLSFLTMFLFKKLSFFTEFGISVLGGVFHNIGQILVATFVMTKTVMLYLPYLWIGGMISGAVVGILSALLIHKVKVPK